MPSVQMCPICRRLRQKCEPVERVWIVGGQQDKCEKCIRFGRECGPHEYTTQHRRRVSSALHNQTSGSDILSQAGIASASAQNPARAIEQIEEDKNELKRRLKSLEVQLEVTQRLQHAVKFIEQTEQQNESLYAEMFRSKNANVRLLCLLPGLAEAFADRLAGYGEIDVAESAYLRILSAYRAYDTLVAHKPWHEVKSLLLKMSDMYKRMGDFRRAAQYTWEALEARKLPKAEPSDLELLKCLGQNLLPEACKDLSAIMQDTGSDLIFPPLQTMMESSYASNTIGNPFQKGPFPEECFNTDEPVVGGINAILNLLDVFPVTELETRDLFGRSPLNLAASLGMEGFGRAILFKAAQDAALSPQILVNSRAANGETVLGAAIRSSCSTSFIKFLIDNEAAIDPVPLTPLFTPLQVAIVLRSLDRVKLLLEHGAQVDRTYLDWQNPVELANGIANGLPEDSIECQIARHLNNDAARQGLNPVADIVWRPP